MYLRSIFVKCIFWWIFKEIVENQDLHRKTFENKLDKICNFFIFKILYFISISVKRKVCGLKGFQKKCDLVTNLLNYLQSDL